MGPDFGAGRLVCKAEAAKWGVRVRLRAAKKVFASVFLIILL
jgi:hypothetical protein